MRIRFYSYFYPPCIGGGEVILHHQAEELVRRGHQVHVHTTPFLNLNLQERGAAGTRTEGGVVVHRRASGVLPFHNPMEKDAVTPAFLADAFLPADLLVCVGYPSFHLDALSGRARQRGTPLGVQNYVTADFLREILAGAGGLNKRIRARYWRRWVRPRLAAARMVLADSPGAAEALRTELALPNVRAHIGMAVDPREFADVSPPDGLAVRARMGLGEDRLILAPSRLSEQKGADLLVEAARPLLGPGWRLVIVGPVNDEAFARRVRALAGGDPRIHFGELPRRELIALMVESEVVCLPSRGETVGGVVFEGMYAGALAVVSDAVEAARDDYLADGRAGLLVPAGDVPALRATLRRAMGEDWSEMRAVGRRLVERRFTWSASVDRLLALYEEARGA